MKKKIGLIGVVIMFLMSPVFIISADETPAKETAPYFPKQSTGLRVGGIIGGTNVLGLAIEYPFAGNSIGLNVGPLEFNDVLFALQVKRYFKTSKIDPYAGIGIEEQMTFSSIGNGHITFLNFPIGINWNIPRNHFIGIEGDFKYPINVEVTGGNEGDYPKKLTFLPGFYYKWGF